MQTTIKTLLLLLYYINQTPLYAAPTISPRIINGTPATTADYPWMVSLGHRCSGTLIAPQWVLTAAHCFLTEDKKTVDLRTEHRLPVMLLADNVEKPSPSAKTIEISEIIVHEGFNPQFGLSDDIALLKLAKPVTDIEPVRLLAGVSPKASEELLEILYQLSVGDIFRYTILGWGVTAYDFQEEASTITLSNVLRATELQWQNKEVCQAKFNTYKISVPDNSFCLVTPNTQVPRSACNGDSGGPALIDAGLTVQVGIASFASPHCSKPEGPTVYTDLSDYQNWISQRVPEAKFYTGCGRIDACSTHVDGDLNASIPCIFYQGDLYQADLRFDKSLSMWRISKLTSSDCPHNSSCASATSDLSLQVINVLQGKQFVNVQLKFEANETIPTWSYQGQSPMQDSKGEICTF